MQTSTIESSHVSQAAHCRKQLKNGSRSFHAAAFLLPARYREPASALYAFCRMADDLIDGPGDTDKALEQLHRRLDSVYRGEPQDYVCDRALTEVVQRHRIPRELLDALLDGFHWDAEDRHYADLSEVLAYSARVAGSVGVMMALLMGVRDPRMLARAADLGVAMQLTNIARDVGEDASLGRVYLPAEWLREAGLEPEELARQPAFSPALGTVIARLLAVADSLYARADSGLARLPASCRPAMYAARRFYAGIGGVVAAREFDSISTRAVVPGRGKLRILLGIPRIFLMAAPQMDAPPLAETAFLIDAAHVGEFAAGQPASPAREGENGIVWVLELFEELHRRDTENTELVPAMKRGGAS